MNTMEHILEVRRKAEAVRSTLEADGARTELLDQPTELANATVDWEEYATSDLATIRGAILDEAQRFTERYYGARLALGTQRSQGSLWEQLESALNPLIDHLNFVEAYGSEHDR